MITGLSLICICLSGVSSIRAQEIAIADSLAKVGQFELAYLYYEKAIFKAESPEVFNAQLFKLGSAYKERGSFQNYAYTLERINKFVLGKEERDQLHYELAFAYYMNKEYGKAQFNFLQYESRLPAYSDDALLLKTLLNGRLEKWDEAEEAYIAYSNDSSVKVEDVFSDIRALKRKNPEKAENLSYFLPGAGQMYAGKPLRGITSFALQSGMLAFAAFNFLNGYYVSGTFTGVSLFYVFYMGGARHAGYLAEEFNKRQKNKAFERLINLIAETKNGQ